MLPGRPGSTVETLLNISRFSRGIFLGLSAGMHSITAFSGSIPLYMRNSDVMQLRRIKLLSSRLGWALAILLAQNPASVDVIACKLSVDVAADRCVHKLYEE